MGACGRIWEIGVYLYQFPKRPLPIVQYMVKIVDSQHNCSSNTQIVVDSGGNVQHLLLSMMPLWTRPLLGP